MNKVKVIAEIGSNWNPSAPIESWQALIQAAADAGADYVKGQDWNPIEEMQRSEEWKRENKAWTLRYTTPMRIMAQNERVGFCTSVFTTTALVTAIVFENPLIKLASSMIYNQDILQQIARVENTLTVALSLGEAKHREQISTAIARLARHDLTLMACVSEYPVKNPLDLLTAQTEAQMFGLPVGVSSHIAYPACLHTVGQAVKRGAMIVEAHLRMEGVTPENSPDNGEWSLYPEQFAELVQVIRNAEKRRR